MDLPNLSIIIGTTKTIFSVVTIPKEKGRMRSEVLLSQGRFKEFASRIFKCEDNPEKIELFIGYNIPNLINVDEEGKSFLPLYPVLRVESKWNTWIFYRKDSAVASDFGINIHKILTSLS